MESLKVYWVRLKAGGYCPFETVNLSDVSTYGVYVIWYNGKPGRVVRVGQGDVKDRITKHRSDKKVLAYQAKGLYVTWAAVVPGLVDQVERYLADHWQPLVGDAFPNVRPLAVNSPFE